MKPTIYFEKGWWRVTLCPSKKYRQYWPRWHAAHQFAARLNNKLHFSK